MTVVYDTMAKKDIAFYGIKYFPSRGGTSRVAENLIRNIKDDYNVTVYCYRHPSAKTHIKGVRTIEIPEIKLGSFGVFLYYFICFLHIGYRDKYDIVHAHKIDSFFFLKSLSQKARVIATAHEAPYKRDKWGRIAKMFFKVNEKRFLRFQGLKTAISEPLCQFYKEKYGAQVYFIPNGINICEGMSHDSVEDHWPKELPKNSPFVFFAARRIMGTKGLHTMLAAYKKRKYQGNIFVAGELDNYPSYIKRVKEISKGLNIHFLGFVSPLSSLLALVQKCEYFVFPSETEGMSIMLLEVASVGKPILASDIPENTQVFDEGEVLFFKNKDVDSLCEKLQWIEGNRSGFQVIGNRAKNKVLSKYTWDKIALEYKKCYERLLQPL